jgi:preprotein translocase SecE subunit
MIKDIPRKIWGFLKAVFAELKLVEFPTRKVTFKTGNVVLAISFLLGLSLFLIDWLFQVLRNLLTSISI